MVSRKEDWLRQAERDLQLAEHLSSDGYHEWACFVSHQAAEKAVKALHLHFGQEAWGHVVAKLLSELPLEVASELIERARVLDNFYVPTRYPNGHPAGAPVDHYGRLQTEEGLRHAGKVLEFVRAQMADGGESSHGDS